MEVKFYFELVAEDGELEVVVVVWFDAGELVKFVEVDDEAISCHLVDGFIVADGVVVSCNYA